ncbi:hypothetical protein ACP8Y2_10785 [Herpetosiphon llansteffanensis]
MTESNHIPIIKYWGFYDIPRGFLVSYKDEYYIFECLFDDNLDDYDNYYTVYKIYSSKIGELKITIDWSIEGYGYEICTVLTKHVDFDPSKRKSISSDIFTHIHQAIDSKSNSIHSSI